MANNMTVEEAIKATFHRFPRNNTYAIPGLYDLNEGDAAFVILACLIIFQMQTGFALVEAGIVRTRNSVNIMMKNIADVCIGGLAFWIFGYGIMFGRGEYTTPFFGAGDFFTDTKFGDPLTAEVFSMLLYQMSYATTSNTIVSGGIAERAKFGSYCLLTFSITILYSLGAGWMWGEHGWLRNLGAVDLSGGLIHLIGGASGVMCAWFIGPRTGRYDKGREQPQMGSPLNALIGLFILWWGWFAFNAGCSFGVTGGKWAYAARAGVGTALASWGAGAFGLVYSMILHKGKVNVYEIISGIIASLVMINSSCYLMPTPICVLFGAFTAFVSISLIPVMDKFGIDDPIGCFSTHWTGGVMAYISVGLFAENPIPLSTTSGREGLLMGGGFWLLSIQLIAILALSLLGFLGAFPIISLVNKILPIRLDVESEEIGCDITEHGVSAHETFTLQPPPITNSMKIKSDEVNLSLPVTPVTLNPPSFFEGSLRNRNLAQYSLTCEENEHTINSPRPIPRL